MTNAVARDVTDEMMLAIFPAVYELHKQERPSGGTEWFLVLKPDETDTTIEDGDHNVLATIKTKVPRKMYSIRDEAENEEIVTLLYPEEY